MLRLNPYQREILDSLAEAGEGYLIPIVYGFAARFPEQPPELLLRITIGAICSLLRAGFITAVREDLQPDEAPPIEGPLAAFDVHRLLQEGAIGWSEGESRWRWFESVGGQSRVRVQLVRRAAS